MPSAILWDARPTAQTIIATTGALKNLANAAIAVSDEVENGTALKTKADLLLYVHDFAAAPTAGGYFECHVVYQMDAVYGDGEDGDLADPNLSANTYVGQFPIIATDEDMHISLMGVEIYPHDFKVCVKNSTGQAIPNTDGSYLKIYTYSHESQ